MPLPPSRDTAAYDWGHRPADHNEKGLYADGPAGERNSLAPIQGETFCRVTASSPEGERKQRVTYRGREAARRQQLEEPDEPPPPPKPRMVLIGRFWRPAKPAASGRKKKAT